MIRSDARLDYPQVDRIFAGEERAEEPWAAPLEAARAAAAALEAERQARGALAIESVEPEFDFSHEGHVTGLVPTEQTESHRLIEHLMIAANEAVATLLETRKLPALYRVHERPEPARVERLVEQLASLDVPTPPLPPAMSPQQAGELVGEISHMVDAHVRRTGRGRAALTSLVLRSLKQARYSPVNLGHAGLRSPRYCHFTSPIRRYPDLICHRALLAAVGGGEDPPEASRMEETAEWASKRERDAMSIERAADDVARCFLLEAELFERGWHAEWPGEVIGVIGAGAVRGLRRRPTRACCRCAACAATGGSSTSRRRCSSARSRAWRCGSAIRWSCRSSASTPRAVAWISRPCSYRGQSRWPARRRPIRDVATNARRPTATTCSRGGRAGWCCRAPRSSRCATARRSSRTATRRCATARSGCTTSTSRPIRRPRRENHEPERPRKLLMHKREIERLIGKTREKGLTLIPTRLYFKGSHAKVEIALAKGKDVGDKRRAIKERELKREMERATRR